MTSQYHEMACFFGGYKHYIDEREGSDQRRLKLILAHYAAPENPTAHLKHQARLTLGDLDDIPLFDNAPYIELERTMEVETVETRDGFWEKQPVLSTRPVSPFYKTFVDLEVRVLPLWQHLQPRVAYEETPDSPSLGRAAARPTFFGGALAKPDILPSITPYKMYDAADLGTNPLKLFSIATVATQIPHQGSGELYTIDTCNRYKSVHFDPVPVKISCRYINMTRQVFFPAASFP